MLILIASCASAAERKDALRHTLGTYGSPPRLPDGRVDCKKLLNELLDLHANCYSWEIEAGEKDFDDLKIFLPMARQKNLRVWASLLPPSESPPLSGGTKYSEPFRLDYDRWAVEFAKLSLQEPNFVAWSIDDFPYNLKVFTPQMMKRVLEASRAINPNFAFVPCVYYGQLTPAFIKDYIPLFDGILFPYRDESHGENLKDPGHVEEEVKSIRERVENDYPIIVDIYVSGHSRLGGTTPQYDEAAIIAAQKCADGVQIFTHQDPEKHPEKYQVIKRLFAKWNTK